MNRTTVPLNPWCVGNTLAEPVRAESGALLLAAGSVLGAQHIDELKGRGIRCVVLAISPAEAEAGQAFADTAASRPPQGRSAEQVQARLQQLFRLSLRDGQINPLLYLLKRYREGATP